MRVVAGKFRSRKIEAVEGMSTRPTADKIKEAIFSRVGPYFQGGRMLDGYGGSGNMGIEAISRGIEHVDCFEIHPKAISTIKKNLKTFNIEHQVAIHRCPIEKNLDLCKEGYDLIYLDPPYANQQNEYLLSEISKRNLLNEDGVVIVESLKEDVFKEEIEDLVCVKQVIYGITKVSYYERKES